MQFYHDPRKTTDQTTMEQTDPKIVENPDIVDPPPEADTEPQPSTSVTTHTPKRLPLE